MPIKAVLLDLDGTLIDESTKLPVPGVPEMIASLKRLNVAVFVASNRPRRVGLDLGALGIERDEMLLRGTVGGGKGTGKFVETVSAHVGAKANEILYLGDDKTDMLEAVNSGIIFFLALWSNPTYEYGLKVSTPERFADVVETFFLKEHLWYYRVDGQDSNGRDVIVRALLDPDEAQNTGIKRLLKEKEDSGLIPHYTTGDFLSMHLLASLYLEGLHLAGTPGKRSIWSLYPGHDGQQTGVLANFTRIASRLFHRYYEPGLIIRHTPAIKSAYARARREHLTIANQLRTIHLNPTLRRKIQDSTVLVFDDFTTYAHSFETARNFLLRGGATRVVCVAVGKYRAVYQAQIPHPAVTWDSYSPTTLSEGDFASERLDTNYDRQALDVFRNLP